MKNRAQELAAENSVKIPPDAHGGDREKDKGDAHGDGQGVVEQAESGSAQSVKNAGERRVQIQEGADKGQGVNAGARGGTAEKERAQSVPEKEKQEGEQGSHGKTRLTGPADHIPNPFSVSKGLEPGHRGHEHHRGGIGEGGGEENERESHSGEDAVHAQGFRRTHAVHAEPLGNQHNLHASQQSEQQPVQGEGKGHDQNTLHAFFYMGNSAGGKLLSVKFVSHEEQAKENNGKFSGKRASHGNERGGLFSLGEKDPEDQPGAAHPYSLLQELHGGGKSCLSPAEIIAGYAGVEGTDGKTEAHQSNEGLCLRLLQDFRGKKSGMTANRPGCQQRKKKGAESTEKKSISGFFFFAQRGLRGGHSGKGRLDSRRGEGQNQSLERNQKLIDSHSPGTNGMREEYSIEESHQPGEDSGAGENQSPPEKTFFGHKIEPEPFFASICTKSP